jgi:hypothetical protein
MPKMSELITGAAPAVGGAAAPRLKLSEVKAAAPKGSLFRADSDFREKSGAGVGTMLGAAARDMFGSEASAGRYLAEQTGGEMVETPDGPMLRLPSGETYRLNDPGLDSTDVSNVAGNVAALWSPAAWVTRFNKAKNLGIGARMLTQGGTMGVGDAALQAGFNGGEYNAGRGVLSVVGGGVGEAFATGAGRGLSYVDRLLGKSDAERAAEIAAKTGFKPSPQQAARLAQAVPQIDAGADPRALIGAEEFGLQYTRGQRQMDPVKKFDLLSREETLRQMPDGINAPLLLAERNNAEAIPAAIERIAGAYGAKPGASPSALMAMIQGKVAGQADELKGRISTAYDAAGKSERAAVSAQAVAGLPDRTRSALRDFDITPDLTPATARTLVQIKSVASLPENVKGVTLRAIETQRRIINHNLGAATNDTDRTAMRVLKEEYDRWVDDAVETALINGDEAALAAIKEARGLRAEFGRRFEGRNADVDKFIQGMVRGGRTPEELLDLALGAGQVNKSSSARFIDRLKVATNDDPEILNAMKAANFLRLTQDAAGRPLDPGRIVSNIAKLNESNPGVIRALYSPEEWAQVQRLASALEPLVAQGTFAKTSGSGERVLRMFQQMFPGLPFLGKLFERMGRAGDAVDAIDAVSAPLVRQPEPIRGLTPVSAALGNQTVR